MHKRKKQAQPIVKKIKTYTHARLKTHEHEHNLKKALNYMVNQIDFIGNYLESSELTPDNNFQESLGLENPQLFAKSSLQTANQRFAA